MAPAKKSYRVWNGSQFFDYDAWGFTIEGGALVLWSEDRKIGAICSSKWTEIKENS